MKKILLILIAFFVSGCNKVDDSKSITSSESEDTHPCPSLFIIYYDCVNGIIFEHEGQKMFYTDESYGFKYPEDYEENETSLYYYLVNKNFVYNGFYSIEWALANNWVTSKGETGQSTIFDSIDEIPLNVNCVASFAVAYNWECQEFYEQYPRLGTIYTLSIFID